MNSVKKYYILIVVMTLWVFGSFQNSSAQKSTLSAPDQKLMADFEKQVKDYVELREQLEDKLPKLPKDATKEQIEAHKLNFQKLVQSSRSNAKQGDIFTPAAGKMIRTIIKQEYKGKDRLELRQTVFEADTKGIPLKINYPYPDSKEQVEMPPTLLLSLPQLPKQLRYRFVGRHLLLVDRENGLIVDYLTKALP